MQLQNQVLRSRAIILTSCHRSLAVPECCKMSASAMVFWSLDKRTYCTSIVQKKSSNTSQPMEVPQQPESSRHPGKQEAEAEPLLVAHPTKKFWLMRILTAFISAGFLLSWSYAYLTELQYIDLSENQNMASDRLADGKDDMLTHACLGWQALSKDARMAKH